MDVNDNDKANTGSSDTYKNMSYKNMTNKITL